MQPLQARRAPIEQLLAQRPRPVLALHTTALLKYWHHTVDELLKSSGQGRVRQIEAIDTGGYPFFELIGYLLGSPDQYRPGPADANGPSIFTALNEQLGLRLESKKAPATVFVIEKIEKPNEN